MRQPTIRSIFRCAAITVFVGMLLVSGDSGAATARSVASRNHAPARGSGPTDPEVVSFVKLMNAHRVSKGLAPLVWDRRAAAVAKAHSRDMLDRDYFSHTSPNGRTTWDRLAARGVTYSRAGENIAYGQRTGSSVLRSWIRSRGHRENIEQDSYTHHGVGKVGPYWTHVFLRPRGAPAIAFEDR